MINKTTTIMIQYTINIISNSVLGVKSIAIIVANLAGAIPNKNS